MSASSETIRARISAVSGIRMDRLADEVEIRALHLDSFAIVEMLVELQEEFNVRLDQADVTSVATVGDLVALVAARSSADRL